MDFLDALASKELAVNPVLMDLTDMMDDLVLLDLLVPKDDLDRLVSLVRKVAVVLTVNFV